MLLFLCLDDGGVLKMLRRLETAIRRSGMAAVAGLLLAAAPGFGQRLENQALSLAANQQDGSYELGTRAGRTHPVLRARVGAEVDHQWIFANEYPRHRSSQSSFNDLLGTGREGVMTCAGLDGKPDLTYRLQLYDGLPYGTIQVEVQNRTAKNVTVQAIRGVEAVDRAPVELAGRESAARVLSDSFSEDWPNLVLYDLGRGPRQMHRGVGSQLIYNRDRKSTRLNSSHLGISTPLPYTTLFRSLRQLQRRLAKPGALRLGTGAAPDASRGGQPAYL